MEHIARPFGEHYRTFAESQDRIGRRRFMEGMILKEAIPIQDAVLAQGALTWTIEAWEKG